MVRKNRGARRFWINLGDPKKYSAPWFCCEIPGVRVVKTSSLYETYPVGCSHDSLSFINGVVLLRTTLLPLELLHELQWIGARFDAFASSSGALERWIRSYSLRRPDYADT